MLYFLHYVDDFQNFHSQYKSSKPGGDTCLHVYHTMNFQVKVLSTIDCHLYLFSLQGLENFIQAHHKKLTLQTVMKHGVYVIHQK